ncbi:unnamed protein product, partial [Bubo scandiacus]
RNTRRRPGRASTGEQEPRRNHNPPRQQCPRSAPGPGIAGLASIRHIRPSEEKQQPGSLEPESSPKAECKFLKRAHTGVCRAA